MTVYKAQFVGEIYTFITSTPNHYKIISTRGNNGDIFVVKPVESITKTLNYDFSKVLIKVILTNKSTVYALGDIDNNCCTIAPIIYKPTAIALINKKILDTYFEKAEVTAEIENLLTLYW